jgi:hypothetical protein
MLEDQPKESCCSGPWEHTHHLASQVFHRVNSGGCRGHRDNRSEVVVDSLGADCEDFEAAGITRFGDQGCCSGNRNNLDISG